MVKDIRTFGGPAPLDAFLLPEFEDLSGILYFPANDGLHSRELWRSDGTEEGTYMLKNILPDRPPCEHPAFDCGFIWNDMGSEIDSLTTVGERMYFTANDGQHGRELWISDGTEEGTSMLADIASGAQHAFREESRGRPESYSSAQFTALDDDVFFVADDGIHGRELWKTDGTTVGTHLVRDIRLGDTNPQDLRVVEGRLLFEASDGSGVRTWTSDGTEAGTRAVGISFPEPPAVSPVVYEDGDFYLTDGTAEGRSLILEGHHLPGSTQHEVHIVGDRAVVFLQLPDSCCGSGPVVYSFDLNVGVVEANGPYVVSETDQLTKVFASEFIGRESRNKSRQGVLYDEVVYSVVSDVPSPTTALLGDNERGVSLEQGSSVTLGFPGPIVDGPGDDLVLRMGKDITGLEVSILTTRGEFVSAGTVTRATGNGGQDLAGLDISHLAEEELGGVVRIERAARRDMRLTAVQANVVSSVILSASANNNLDLRFSWDINGDGVYGDREGRQVSLTSAELAALGLAEPGDYSVSVRMNDRTTDYFDDAILTIPGADVEVMRNADGIVGFSDFLVLSANFGRELAVRSEGDIDGDGTVTFADFLILRDNFGR